LKPDESALHNLLRIGGARARRMTELELRDFLARFGFRGDRVFEPVEPFSGGEKARLVLALVTFQRPNLLLLDEPTNHLDLEMRQALSVALQEYTGAVVLVSHDRHLLNTVADQFYVVHGGRAELFDGDLEDYARWLVEGSGSAESQQEHDQAAIAAPIVMPAAATAAATVATSTAARAAALPAPKPAAADRKQQRRDEAAARARIAPLRAEVRALEQRLAELSRQRAEVEQQLGDSGIYEEAASAKLDKLLGQQSRIASDIEAAEANWLKALEQLEQIERL
jgi:ATP-binding cassette subfamily F protein 3